VTAVIRRLAIETLLSAAVAGLCWVTSLIIEREGGEQ
jgi:hypothetical protein